MNGTVLGKTSVVIFPEVGEDIILAVKQPRGEGVGLLSGYGGWVRKMDIEGGTVEEAAALRIFTTKSGSSFSIESGALESVALVTSFCGEDMESICMFFLLHQFDPYPRATADMGTPQQFPKCCLPNELMRPGDAEILTQIFQGKRRRWICAYEDTTKRKLLRPVQDIGPL